MSSSCSLSSAPVTPEPEPELEILVLRRGPRWRNNLALTVSTKLKKSSAYIFTARLFTCTSLDTSPASVLYSWKVKQYDYLIMARIAKDYLPILLRQRPQSVYLVKSVILLPKRGTD